MKQKYITFLSNGFNLKGIISIPDNPSKVGIILFHGLSNTKEDCPLIEQTSNELVKNGFVTFRFDFFGSGESPGEMKDKTISILKINCIDAIHFFKNNYQIEKIGLWGRSFGGTLINLISINQFNCSVQLSSPIILTDVFDKKKIDKLIEKEKKSEEIGMKLAGTGHYKGEYGLGYNWYDELIFFEKEIEQNSKKNINALFIATNPDNKVPYENSIRAFQLSNYPKELHIFSNTNHAYEGIEGDVIELTLGWFKRYLRDPNEF